MAGYADELSVKLTAQDEMSARLKGVRKELKTTEKAMAAARKELDNTGAPAAAAELRRLETQYDKLADSQRDLAKSSSLVKKDLERLRGEAGKSTTAMGRLGRAVEKHAKTIQRTGLVMGAAMALFAKSSITAFAGAEKSQMRLALAYSKFPALADTNITAMRALNDELMNRTGADNDALAAAEANLAMYELTGRQIMDLIPLVNDYAIASGQEVPDAATSVGRALMGNARALKALGIDFKVTGDRSKDLAALMDGLREKVGGVGDAFGKTTAGDLKIAQENFAELQETVGAQLAPALAAVVGIVKPLGEWFRGIPGPVRAVAMVIGALGVAAMIATPRLIALKAAMTQANVAGGSLRTGMRNIIGGLGSPWTIALAAGALALGAFAQEAADSEARVAALGDQIDATTGKLTAAGMAAQAKTLMDEFSGESWKMWQQYGVTVEGVVNAIAAGGATWDAMHRKMRVLEGQMGINSIGFGTLADKAGEMAGEVQSAKDAFQIGSNAAAMFGVEVDEASDEAAEATVQISALSRAVGKLMGVAGRQQALTGLRKAIKAALGKPSKEAAYEAIQAFDATFRTFKDGSKAQARFVQQNYADMKGVVTRSGLSDRMQEQLLTPLRLAKREADKLMDALKTIDGTQVSIGVSNLGALSKYRPMTPVRPYTGGLITGPGSGTSDSIPAMVSNGEYVIRASAVDALGVDYLQRLNHADKMPIPSLPRMPAAGGSSSTTIGGDTFAVTQHITAQGQIDYEMGMQREFRRLERDRRTRTAGTR